MRLRCFFDGVSINMPDGVSSVVTSLTLGLCTILVPSKSTLLGAVAGGGGGAVFASTLTFFAGLLVDSDLTVDDFLRSRLTGLSNGACSSFKSLPS